jgi:hypothetical protein
MVDRHNYNGVVEQRGTDQGVPHQCLFNCSESFVGGFGGIVRSPGKMHDDMAVGGGILPLREKRLRLVLLLSLSPVGSPVSIRWLHDALGGDWLCGGYERGRLRGAAASGGSTLIGAVS